jgi:hypothetical protein
VQVHGQALGIAVGGDGGVARCRPHPAVVERVQRTIGLRTPAKRSAWVDVLQTGRSSEQPTFRTGPHRGPHAVRAPGSLPGSAISRTRGSAARMRRFVMRRGMPPANRAAHRAPTE